MKHSNFLGFAVVSVIIAAGANLYAAEKKLDSKPVVKRTFTREYDVRVSGDSLTRGGIRLAANLDDGFSTSEYERLYDKQGQCIEELWYSKTRGADSVIRVRITYDDSGNHLTYVAGSPTRTRIDQQYIYNRKGQVVYERYTTTGPMPVTDERFYYYSKQGLLDSCLYKSKSPGRNYLKTYAYEFHPNGKMKLKVEKIRSTTMIFWYNTEGILTYSETTSADRDTAFNKRHYDHKGRVIKSSDWMGVAGTVESEYEYDAQDHQIIQRILRGSPSMYTLFEGLYNEHGDKIYSSRVECTPVKQEVCDHSRYVYKYDKHGNWTERIDFHNGEPKQITEREIEYY